MKISLCQPTCRYMIVLCKLFRNLCSSTDRFYDDGKKVRNETENVGWERNQRKSSFIGYLFNNYQNKRQILWHPGP